MADCIFCKIIDKKVPSELIFENEHILVIKDIAPKAEVHYLIMPKKHIRNIQSLEKQDLFLGSEIFAAAQELAKRDLKNREFKLVSNNGSKAGQVIFHLHFHFIAGTHFSKFVV